MNYFFLTKVCCWYWIEYIVPIWGPSRTPHSFFGLFILYLILNLLAFLGERLLLLHQLSLLLLPVEFYLLYFFFFVFVLFLQLLDKLILFFFLGIRLATFLLFLVLAFATAAAMRWLIVMTIE